uniref:Eukaryotic translation initiation factor 2 subunit 2 n=1 Tax=Mesocestoides corti TaxID=53468 RepID=A0A5K3F1H1_MESCO
MSTVPSETLDFSSKKKKKTKNPVPVAPPEEEKPAEAVNELPDFGAKKKKPKPIPETTESTTVDNAETLDFGAKKKKKTNVVVTINDGATAASPDAAAADKLSDQLGDLTFADKKKKAKRHIEESELAAAAGGEGAAAAAETGDAQPSTYGYPYETLLARVFAQIQAKNPELMSDQKRRLVMAPPCMARVGTKKTHFTNFTSICRSLDRDPAHLSAYMFAELGTTGSLDATGGLLIKGKYQSKHIEPVLRNYARSYVLCSTCQSPDTFLSKDSRLLFLHCRRCGSKITVKNVTSGFQAVTGKRAAIRAKT